MRDAADVEDGVKVFERIETSVVAEGTLAAEFVEVHVSLDHDFTRSWNFEIDGFAFDQIDRRSAKKSSDQVLLNFRRRGHDGTESYCRISTDCDCHFHLARRAFSFGQNRTARRPCHDVD